MEQETQSESIQHPGYRFPFDREWRLHQPLRLRNLRSVQVSILSFAFSGADHWSHWRRSATRDNHSFPTQVMFGTMIIWSLLFKQLASWCNTTSCIDGIPALLLYAIALTTEITGSWAGILAQAHVTTIFSEVAFPNRRTNYLPGVFARRSENTGIHGAPFVWKYTYQVWIGVLLTRMEDYVKGALSVIDGLHLLQKESTSRLLLRARVNVPIPMVRLVRTPFIEKFPSVTRVRWFNLSILTITPVLAIYGLLTVLPDSRTSVFAILYYIFSMLGGYEHCDLFIC